MERKVDITMTAVIRPKLLTDTLQKIKRFIMKKQSNVDFRLIINIDPIGEKINPIKVVEIIQDNFKNVLYNIPDRPSFPKAVKWVWSQSNAPFVLHWEDDINILRRIDINDMMNILDKHKLISSLRLYKHKTPKSKTIDTFGCKWIYEEDGFYRAVDWKKQFGLNPILIKQEYVSEAVTRMIETLNPEKQFRSSQKYMVPLIKKWRCGLYTKPGEQRLIDGRKGQVWKDKMKLQKPKGQTFLEWEKR